MNRPLNRILPRVTGPASVWTWVKWSLLAALLIALAIVARLVQTEIETSRLQARYLSELTRDVGYTVEAGPSDHIRFPANGPYDQRFGYAMIPRSSSGCSRAASSSASRRAIRSGCWRSASAGCSFLMKRRTRRA
ncbi:hypothetical protein SY91_03318 [Burkholderia cenocepacia]|nr:hypothetical protein SY91_03318 [Burkholderia cenocepacia]